LSDIGTKLAVETVGITIQKRKEWQVFSVLEKHIHQRQSYISDTESRAILPKCKK